MIAEFDKIPVIDSKFGKEIYSSPFVVRGGFLRDGLFKEMSLDNIKHKYANEVISTQKSIYDDKGPEEKLARFVEGVIRGQDIASWSWQPHLTFDELNQLPSVLDELGCFFRVDIDLFLSLLCPWILISSVGTRTHIHKDYLSVHGIIGQIEGEKIFRLACPETKIEDGRFYGSESFLEEITLSVGDLLYFPENWWHQAETTKTSVSFVGNIVNSVNIDNFMRLSIQRLPELVSRVTSSLYKRKKIGDFLKWHSKGFIVLNEE